MRCRLIKSIAYRGRFLISSQLLESSIKQRAFVSITQHFNTNTSMGRLTLNILLSFPQFEREIISERTRDKLSAARKAGPVARRAPPFGYAYNPNEKMARSSLIPTPPNRPTRLQTLP